MKTNLLFLVCFISTGALFAQTYVDIPWRAGTITTKKDEVKEGYIRLGGDLGALYLNNSKVYFVAAEDHIEGKKPKKKKIKEYKPDDIKGYSTYTENSEGERIQMDHMTGEVMKPGLVKAKKGKAFLWRKVEGEKEVYIFVPKPSKKLVTTADERSDDLKKSEASATYYLRMEDEFKKVVDLDLIKVLSDCPDVVEKIENEAYGFKPKSKRKKKKGFGKLMAAAVGDNKMEQDICRAIIDYNECVEEK